jgi:pyrroline-5-carboxylate reductase
MGGASASSKQPNQANSTQGLVVVGGGKMAEALLAGVLKDACAAQQRGVTIVEQLPARRAQLVDLFPHCHITDSLDGVKIVSALIAVKPNDVEHVCRSIRQAGARRALSVAAGITIAQLESWMGPGVAVIRSMPNTPALVGQGASALSGGTTATADDVAWAHQLLSKVGVAVTVPEAKLDAVTGLSGSGPAYVFLVAEAMIEAGVLMGLTRDVAETLAKQTLLGAATLLSTSDEDAAKLRANVTSPGGTTAAGLRALEEHGVRAAFLNAVAAATNRSIELRN